jgi:hypothetical protein
MSKFPYWGYSLTSYKHSLSTNNYLFYQLTRFLNMCCVMTCQTVSVLRDSFMRFVYPFFYYTILPGGLIIALEAFWIWLRFRWDIRVQYSVLERQPRPSPRGLYPQCASSLPWSWSMCEIFSMHAHKHACMSASLKACILSMVTYISTHAIISM